MLTSLGYVPVAYTDVEEALAKCTEEQFSVALVDVLMPKMLGHDTLCRLREKIPETTLVLMTGYGMAADSLGFTGRILAKPFELETLAQLMKESVQRG